MFNYLYRCVAHYFDEHRWNTQNQLSNLLAPSQEVLDFPVPSDFRMMLARPISPHLKTVHTLGVPGIFRFGILYTHRPQVVGVDYGSLLAPLELQPKPHGAHEKADDDIPDHLIYGQVLEDGRLEGLLAVHLSPGLTARFSGVSCVHDMSHGNIHLDLDRPRYNVSAMMTTDGWLFGLRGLYHMRLPSLHPSELANSLSFAALTEEPIGSSSNEPDSNVISASTAPSGSASVASDISEGAKASQDKDISSTSGKLTSSSSIAQQSSPRLTVGGEAYYTASENSGGLAACVRLMHPTEPYPQLSCTMNLTMGNLSVSHVNKAFHKDLTLAARYDYNVYSYESDLTLGAEWRKQGTTKQVLRVKASLEEGFAIQHSIIRGPFLVTSGFRTDLLQPQRRPPSAGFGLEITAIGNDEPTDIGDGRGKSKGASSTWSRWSSITEQFTGSSNGGKLNSTGLFESSHDKS